MLSLVLLLNSVGMLPASSALVESRAEGRFAEEDRGRAMLVDFRTDSIRNWRITKAKLYVFVVSGEIPAQLPVSTVTRNWTEDAPGSAVAGTFGRGESKESPCPAKPLPQGWLEVEIPPAFLEAMAAGKSYGLAWLPGAARINGRAPAFRQPYILVEGDPAK